MLLIIFLIQFILDIVLASNEGKKVVGKEREWEYCAYPGPVLPETCHRKGINFRYRENEKRYNNSTLEGCYDKCKGRCQVVK